MGEFTGTMPLPKNGIPFLCEPAHSKRIRACHKIKFMRQFSGKSPGPKTGPPFWASLQSRNAHGHVTRAILRESLQKQNRPQERDPRFARACAVEVHILCENLQGKSRGSRAGQPRTLCEPGQPKCICTWQKATFMREFAANSICPGLGENPDRTPAYRKDPSGSQCSGTVWGKNGRKGTIKTKTFYFSMVPP